MKLEFSGFFFAFPQKPVDGLSVRQKQTETPNAAESDEFNSFQFWREPLPSLDSELLALLVSRTNRKSGIITSLIDQSTTEK